VAKNAVNPLGFVFGRGEACTAATFTWINALKFRLLGPALGKNGHLADCMAGPADAAAICSQSWAPLRRQQDGKLESRLAAKAAGAISEKLKEASTVSASVQRTE
jgi:hypothetical protein